MALNSSTVEEIVNKLTSKSDYVPRIIIELNLMMICPFTKGKVDYHQFNSAMLAADLIMDQRGFSPDPKGLGYERDEGQ